MSRFEYHTGSRFARRTAAIGLAKDPDRAILFGVCAGIARYLGISPLAVRLLTGLSLFLSFGITVVVYLGLALALNSVRSEREAFIFTRSSYRYRW